MATAPARSISTINGRSHRDQLGGAGSILGWGCGEVSIKPTGGGGISVCGSLSSTRAIATRPRQAHKNRVLWLARRIPIDPWHAFSLWDYITWAWRFKCNSRHLIGQTVRSY